MLSITHFNGDSHSGFLENFSITLTDKTDPSDPEKRENYWIQTLKTMVPWGLNVMGNKVDRTLTAINVQSLFFLLLALDHHVRISFVFGQDFWIHYIYCFIYCNIK